MKTIHSASILPRPLDALLSTLVHRIWWREGYVYVFPQIPQLLQFDLFGKMKWPCSWNHLSLIPQCTVQCLLTWVPNCSCYYFVPISIFFIYHLLLVCAPFIFLLFCWLLLHVLFSYLLYKTTTDTKSHSWVDWILLSVLVFNPSNWLKTSWLTQTYIVLHAASFSSWIDISNHKGKHFTKLCILNYGVIQLADYRQTSGSLNKEYFVLVIRFNFWLIWTSRRHHSWWNCLMTARLTITFSHCFSPACFDCLIFSICFLKL